MLDASLVIPCFNRPHLVEEGLRWLMKQTWPHDRFEVILVDDSGPENYHLNRAVVDRMQVDFPLSLFTTGLPKDVYGVTVARNIGMREAQSPLVVYTDDDCFCHPHLIEQHILPHRETDRLMLTGYRADEESALHEPIPMKLTREKCIREFEKSQRGELGPGDFKTGNASVKRAHLLEVGGFNESMAKQHEYGYTDRELAMRLLDNRMTFRVNPNAVVYVIPTDQATLEYRERHQVQAKARARFQEIERTWKRGKLVKRIKSFFGFGAE